MSAYVHMTAHGTGYYGVPEPQPGESPPDRRLVPVRYVGVHVDDSEVAVLQLPRQARVRAAEKLFSALRERERQRAAEARRKLPLLIQAYAQRAAELR